MQRQQSELQSEKKTREGMLLQPKIVFVTLHSPNIMLTLSPSQLTFITSISASFFPQSIFNCLRSGRKCSKTLMPLTQKDGVPSSTDLIPFIKEILSHISNPEIKSFSSDI